MQTATQNANKTDAFLAFCLIARWIEMRKWAEAFLVSRLGLSRAEDVLAFRPKGELRSIPETDWLYQTHGNGVLLTKANELGGIDFDFDKPFPDEWRLKWFLEAQLADGALDSDLYQPFLDDEARWRNATQALLRDEAFLPLWRLIERQAAQNFHLARLVKASEFSQPKPFDNGSR